MNGAQYNDAAFQTFRNALVYTVCAETVGTLIDDSNTTALTVLIAIFGILVSLSANAREVVKAFADNGQSLKLVLFLWESMHNVLIQFASTLVAKVSIAALPPSSDHTAWILGLTLLTLTLLWLLKESTSA
tara:strand:+ start:650 stop:1042 length:393 start_codon:yes stop_codon:yes gene_type:complete